jgi:hypothetical protein
MMGSGASSSSRPAPAPVMASFTMSSDDNTTTGSSIKKSWDPGGGNPGVKKVLFTPDEFDIFCNKVTLDTYIFHGKVVDYDAIDHLEFDHKSYDVDVVLKNGIRMDLGTKIQWLVRPYLGKAHEVSIVQTKDGQSVNGVVVPLKHVNKK